MRHAAARTQAFHRRAQVLGVTERWVVRTDFSDELGAAATRTLLASTPRPTAVVDDNDVMAVAGLGVATELGMAVPTDVSLLACDDSPLGRITHPPLSAMSRDVAGSARRPGACCSPWSTDSGWAP
ncbi:MAG TPA: substrate-binding domain-containing protein [Kineosporiaceae bacterium]